MEDFEYINKKIGTSYASNDDINWNKLSCYKYLTEAFIEKFQDKLNWNNISYYQPLSEEFIEKHDNRVS